MECIGHARGRTIYGHYNNWILTKSVLTAEEINTIFLCATDHLALASLGIALRTYTRKHIVTTQTPEEHSTPSCRKT